MLSILVLTTKRELRRNPRSRPETPVSNSENYVHIVRMIGDLLFRHLLYSISKLILTLTTTLDDISLIFSHTQPALLPQIILCRHVSKYDLRVLDWDDVSFWFQFFSRNVETWKYVLEYPGLLFVDYHLEMSEENHGTVLEFSRFCFFVPLLKM